MARNELDGLPDFTAILQRFFARVFKFRKVRTAWDTLPVEPAVNPARRSARPVRSVKDDANPPQVADSVSVALPTRRRSVTGSATLKSPTEALRERAFVRQAIVINEILARPVALRRRKSQSR